MMGVSPLLPPCSTCVRCIKESFSKWKRTPAAAHTNIFVTSCSISCRKMETLLALWIALTLSVSASSTTSQVVMTTISPSATRRETSATNDHTTASGSAASLPAATNDHTTASGSAASLPGATNDHTTASGSAASLPSTPSNHLTTPGSETPTKTSHTIGSTSRETNSASDHMSASPGHPSPTSNTIHGSQNPVSTGSSSVVSISSHQPITAKSPPPSGGVPGWGIALLVLAALVLLLLILLLVGLHHWSCPATLRTTFSRLAVPQFVLSTCRATQLVWCCCYRGHYRGFSPYDHLSNRDDIPLYTTHSRFGGPNGKPHKDPEKPMKNRTGTYTVNQ